MKRILLLLSLLTLITLSSYIKAQDKPTEYRILLTGASFASSNNGWFELGCKHLNAEAVNRAVGGEAIADAANSIVKGSLYTLAELDSIDAFVIMHVHNKDVIENSRMRENYRDYETPFDRSNYAAAYDYVIKRYMTDCYNLKFNKESRYYNTPSGKPAVIVLSTHWHDGRAVYNSSVRKLSEKWGFPLIEFDKYIGFSKNHLHPATDKQHSILFTNNNTETTDGVAYGWHQTSGQDKYIQQRMAAIFVDTMRKVLPLK